MKIKIARVYPEKNESTEELYFRMCENLDLFIDKHPELSVGVSYDIKDGCVTVKTLNMEFAVN